MKDNKRLSAMFDDDFDEIINEIEQENAGLTDQELKEKRDREEQERKMMLEARELLMADIDPYPDPEAEFEKYKEQVIREAYEEMLREDAMEAKEDDR